MNRYTSASIVLIFFLLTILTAWVFSDLSQYSAPIQTINGVTIIHTTNGDQVYKDVEYLSNNVVSVKPTAINTLPQNAPAALPNTSAPHGTHTCNMGNYTVTTDQACSELQ